MRSPSRARTTDLRGLCLALACLAAPGCVAVSADIEQVRHSVQTQQLTFEGAGPLAGQRVSETRVFDASLGSELMDYVVHAKLTDLRVVPASGVSSLDFVHAVRIRLLATGGNPDVLLAEFSRERSPASASDGALTLQVNDDFDHTRYVRARVPFELELEMDAPAAPWSVGVDLGLDLELGYELRF
ncbi:MAG: hypothetical protein IPL40_08490 [Proteobacteria bacterium]|nr:hypothetical protein [Pseudomonadota bacterium]